MQRIITNTEIKTLLGIGSASDVLVDMWNDAATELLCNTLEISDIASHSVTNERVTIVDHSEITFEEFPVLKSSVVLKTTFDQTVVSGYTLAADSGKIRTFRVYNSDGNLPFPLPYDEVFASYTAGYTTQDVLTVASITDLANKTFTVKIAGVTTTYTLVTSGATGNQINIGVDAATTAAAIAAKLGGSCIGAIVTLPLGSSVSLGSATASQLVIVNSNVPVSLKNAIALIAAGGIAAKEQKGGAIVSYSIGGKSVSFRNESEAAAVDMVIKNWLSQYKKIKIYGI